MSAVIQVFYTKHSTDVKRHFLDQISALTMNVYNLRQQRSKEETKAKTPKLSKCKYTWTMRSLDCQRQNIIKQIQLSVLQVKAATLPVTLLLVTVTNWQWSNPFPPIPNHCVRPTIVIHSIQLREVFFSGFSLGLILLFWGVLCCFGLVF